MIHDPTELPSLSIGTKIYNIHHINTLIDEQKLANSALVYLYTYPHRWWNLLGHDIESKKLYSTKKKKKRSQ